MTTYDNQPFRIFLKATREWVEVPEEYYRDHVHYYDTYRNRQKAHGRCVCPKSKFWLCDGDCCSCEFRRAGDMCSLDYEMENEEGDAFTALDSLADPSPLIEDIISDRDQLTHLFQRLGEIMPEALRIGELRLQGLSDSAIAGMVGIKRTTFLSRINKAKKILADEFPDLSL